jgi:hypothetical protein
MVAGGSREINERRADHAVSWLHTSHSPLAIAGVITNFICVNMLCILSSIQGLWLGIRANAQWLLAGSHS